jgi:pimeloyl-ACP methyl ester carboxylesterase
MTSRARWSALAAALLLVGACAGDPGVRTVRSGALPTSFDRAVPLQPVVDLPSIEPVTWTSCDDQPAPWECGTIEVPLDYRHALDVGHLTIAVTRLPATDSSSRIGSLVLNPGGPGGSGVDLAWGYAAQFPPELLGRFDLVGFDPRGVGRSTAVDCGDLERSFRVVLRTCLSHSGDLLPYVGTQNAARDMEQLRKALGDERLTYLGFSYGTALGAVYADLFPSSIRAAVLDGSVDPQAGEYNVDGTVVGSFGTPFYGVQDFGGTVDVFLQLCDATRSCTAGPDSWTLLQDLYGSIDDADVRYFDDWDETVSADQINGIITSAMYNTDLWAPLAVGLADATDGDASTLAALGSFLEAGYPRQENSFDNLTEANVAIYCADFAGRHGEFAVDGCRGWPETNEPLPPITEVDVATPIVVIGTDGDPATPGFLAPQMAEALGDAVSVRWQGAGHTAFLHSECVDQIVIDYLVDLTVPKNRSRCAFTDDVNTMVARAEQVFVLNHDRFETRLTKVLTEEGLASEDATCVARGIVAEASDSVLVYARLGVRKPEYVRLRRDVEADCGVVNSME